MSSDNDDWREIPEATGLGGIFSGDGLSDYNSAPTKLKRDGLNISTKCERCGRPKLITVTFLEMVFVSMGREPPEWYYDAEHGLMRWRRGCACSDQVRPYPFGITPSECTQNLNKAMSYGFLTPAQAEQMKGHVMGQPVAR